MLRLTTDAPVSYVLAETPFLLENGVSFVLGADETLTESAEQTARTFQEETEAQWRRWTRSLSIPPEWQEAVMRAAITLKLCTFEETGAIVAAMTTSIPEAPDSGRNWDYRYCWLRDAFFVVRALNSLSEVDTMEHYLRYLANIVGQAPDGHLQPVYGIALERRLDERELATLSGYRGMRPVRVGNQAFEHLQHDVYGNVVLGDRAVLLRPPAAAPRNGPGFRAARARRRAGVSRLCDGGREHVGAAHARARAHLVGAHVLGGLRPPRADRGAPRAARAGAALAGPRRGNTRRDRGARLRCGARQLHGQLRRQRRRGGAAPDGARSASCRRRTRALPAPSPRSRSACCRGRHLFRYAAADDFGMPTTAFNICTFWYIDALARLGRRDEARELFEHMLASRNHVGLLSEDSDPENGEHWGNYPQTYSLVGIINAATRLSRGWDAFT